MSKQKDILNWLLTREKIFTKILDNLISMLKKKSDGLNIETATQPEKRIKEKSKIDRKLSRKKYSNKDELTDYAGCRFIFQKKEDALLFFDDINSDKQFNIDDKNTIDKRLLYDPDRFGYLSFHIVLSLKEFPEDILRIIKKKFPGDKAEDYKIEIQIRTIIQHIWAIISRKLVYDDIDTVPFKLRKRFYRLGAMLEAIDDEVEILFRDHKQKSEILKDNSFLKQKINHKNLEQYLEMQVENNILITDKLHGWVDDLNVVEVDTIGEFHEILMAFYKDFYPIYRGKISKIIKEEGARVSIDDFCGFPGWMIDAIIWHNPNKYKENFHSRQAQFSNPNLTIKYIEWLIDAR